MKNMNSKFNITVAICTRNRPIDLKRCIESVLTQQELVFGVKIEVLIIDDGELCPQYFDQFNNRLEPYFEITYIKKRSPGLLLSRIEALSKAKHDIILFLDDDVEIYPNYLVRLIEIYSSSDDIVGVGGIDILLKPPSIYGMIYNWLILYSSGVAGKLSYTGYHGSLVLWGNQKSSFAAESLSGCNMSFRKVAIKSLTAVEWLRGYSLAEDLYLSLLAHQTGKLLVDPRLKVKHFQSPEARDGSEIVAYTEIANHYYLLEIKGAKYTKHLMQVWTAIGMYFRALIKRQRLKSRGYSKGIIFIIKNLFKKTK